MTPLEAHHLIGWTQQWRQVQVLVDLLKHLKVAMGNTVPRLLMAVSENHPNIAHSLSSFSLWFITPISLGFIGDISILNGIITHLELKGAPPCMVYHHSPSHCWILEMGMPHFQTHKMFEMEFVWFFPTDTSTRTMTCWLRGWQSAASMRLTNDLLKSSNVWKLFRWSCNGFAKLQVGEWWPVFLFFVFVGFPSYIHHWPFLVLRLVVWCRQETACLQALWIIG